MKATWFSWVWTFITQFLPKNKDFCTLHCGCADFFYHDSRTVLYFRCFWYKNGRYLTQSSRTMMDDEPSSGSFAKVRIISCLKFKKTLSSSIGGQQILNIKNMQKQCSLQTLGFDKPTLSSAIFSPVSQSHMFLTSFWSFGNQAWSSNYFCLVGYTTGAL